MATSTNHQNVVLSPLPPSGQRTPNWLGGGRLGGPPSSGSTRFTDVRAFEAVGDIEITNSVELATEPGVMGRIGPMFPRSATFRIRLHGTGDSEQAMEDHAYLNSLIGRLLYIDARASPAEKIVWTLENVKAMDDNSAINAFDVEVTAREIIGGEFGDLFPVDKLETSIGLVPVELVQEPDILGVGDQVLTVSMKEALLFTGGEDRNGELIGAYPKGRQVLAVNIYVRHNENAIATVTADGIAAGKTLDTLEGQLSRNNTHINIFGGALPTMANCTKLSLKFTIYGKEMRLEIDATQNVNYVKLFVEDQVYIMQPMTPTFVSTVFEEYIPVESRRTDYDPRSYPQNRDAIFVLHSHSTSKFTVEEFPKWTLLVFVAGDLT